MMPLPLLGAVAMLAAGGAALAAPSDDPLARHRGSSRIIVAFARSAADPLLGRQRQLYHDMRQGARERDLILVEAVGTSPDAEALRRRFEPAEAFTALLIGKDGGEKLRSETPVGAPDLFPLIDSMPMRQDEMRRQR